MHIQAKAKAALSPADLGSFLRTVTGPPEHEINIEGVTGCNVEGDEPGDFVFAVEHGRAALAHDRLTAPQETAEGEKAYAVWWTKDLYVEDVPSAQGVGTDDPNQPGVLLGIIERAKGSQIAGGRQIDTVLIGARTGQPGIFGVQVTFIGSAWSTDRPSDED